MRERFGQAANRDAGRAILSPGRAAKGEITPEEARAWVERLTGDADLAVRAYLAMEGLDRGLYRRVQDDPNSADFRLEFHAVFLELCSKAGTEKPREAPGAA